jgi:hypothetical protein
MAASIQELQQHVHDTLPPPIARRRQPLFLTRVVGGFFLWTSGIHVGLVAADAEFYRDFATAAVPFVREAWADVFMAHPVVWGLAVALGELVIGILTLRGGRATVVGLAGAVVFHLCLLLFGVGYAFWVVPALLLLVPLLVREWRDT